MHINWAKIEPKKRRAMLREARAYLRFMCQLYKIQHQGGRMFLHEHPASAKSWAEEEVQEILKLEGVVRARLDMRMYNLTTDGPDGPGPSKKPTDIMTNNSQFAQYLARQ